MLVLSRRVEEKLLFPGLGISLEVVRVKGNTVRIGIDAPRDVRVVRGELAERESVAGKPVAGKPVAGKPVAGKPVAGKPVAGKPVAGKPAGKQQPAVSNANVTDDSKAEIRRRLNAANLAIHLAQNQLQQGRNRNVAYALEDAIRCLRSLESAVLGKLQTDGAVVSDESGNVAKDGVGSIERMRDSESAGAVEYAPAPVGLPGIESVRESSSSYVTSARKRTALVQFEDHGLVGVSNLVGEDGLAGKLAELGYDIVSVKDNDGMIRYNNRNFSGWFTSRAAAISLLKVLEVAS